MSPVSTSRISVVIPAYKATFLTAALESLTRQTVRPFEVLVADDASPHDLKTLCSPFAQRLNLRYQRFPENLGRRSLTSHWTRAIELAHGEWIWLMGDDDELESGCIETVQSAIRASGGVSRLWRVETVQIDDAGRFLRDCANYPDILTAHDYLRYRMAGTLWSFACEYVFRSDTFRESGGFVDFPLGWCSDDASWIRLAGSCGGNIVTARGVDSRARYRMSGENISSAGIASHREKLEARLRYLEWLDGDEAERWIGCRMSKDSALGQQALDWFLRTMYSSRTLLPYALWWSTTTRLARSTGMPRTRVMFQLARIRRWVWAQRAGEAR